MIQVRSKDARGHTRIDWLDSWHTFSFGDYFDPEHAGFRSLRVLNDDRVIPGAGFGTHAHRDMEILSFVLDGVLEHRDSMGNGSLIRPGEIQFMRAGTGVTHSERNPSPIEPVHFLQIWIVPSRKGLPPAYAQNRIDEAASTVGWVLLASPDGRGNSIQVEQDAFVSLVRPAAGASISLTLDSARHTWLHVATGSARLGDLELEAGDGVAVTGERALTLVGGDGAATNQILAFDLA